MIDWTFNNEKTGQRVAEYQSENTLAEYDRAGREAQQLANRLGHGIAFTAWHEDGEGATGYRYPKKRTKPQRD